MLEMFKFNLGYLQEKNGSRSPNFWFVFLIWYWNFSMFDYIGIKNKMCHENQSQTNNYYRNSYTHFCQVFEKKVYDMHYYFQIKSDENVTLKINLDI